MKKKKFDKSYCPLIMIIFPLLLLSLFPHQEPRFLIPILPLVVMTGIEQIEEKSKMKNVFIFVWILFSILLTPIYGVLHQE
jgi:phosphatidylinositol glycan class Z